jgi:4-hydroxy-4-methyl-2-oxoglutarate aldolase
VGADREGDHRRPPEVSGAVTQTEIVTMSDEQLRTKLETLRRLGAATVHEAMGQRGYVDRAIAPLDPTTRIAGPAYTVDSKPHDNLMMHYALSKAQPGDIIVVDYKGYTRAAAWGDLMTHSARAHRIGGLVVDGAVRDAAAIVDMGFPVYCRGLCITGPTKNQIGRVGVPINVGGCTVRPGDIVVGDRDGVCIVPFDEVDAVIRAAEAREQREAAIIDRLASGATTVELLGLADVLHDAGLH